MKSELPEERHNTSTTKISELRFSTTNIDSPYKDLTWRGAHHTAEDHPQQNNETIKQNPPGLDAPWESHSNHDTPEGETFSHTEFNVSNIRDPIDVLLLLCIIIDFFQA